jgi:hypothetical protein
MTATLKTLAAEYNALAAKLGKRQVTAFKCSLAVAQVKVTALYMDDAAQTAAKKPKASDTKIVDAKKTAKAGDTIGKAIIAMIAAGKTNKAIMEHVKAQFPDAATSMGCVYWYRSKIKSGDISAA